MSIQILCVDDHAVVREGIALIVRSQRDMGVVAAAATGEQAVDLFRQHQPDITLMDLRLPKMSGLEAIETIRAEHPDAKVIVLTMHDEDETIYRALEAGAATYLLKDTLSQDLIRVIREVYAGRSPLPDNIAARLMRRDNAPALTPRETTVVQLMYRGMTNKEISTALRISDETVHAHVKSVLAKLGANNRTAAVTTALRRGIVQLD